MDDFLKVIQCPFFKVQVRVLVLVHTGWAHHGLVAKVTF
jgi:hypothetical protein